MLGTAAHPLRSGPPTRARGILEVMCRQGFFSPAINHYIKSVPQLVFPADIHKSLLTISRTDNIDGMEIKGQMKAMLQIIT